MRFRLWRPAGIFAGLALLFSAAPAFAQQVASQAVLDRVTIVEGQTRRFQISNVASRPRYHVHASVSGAFTAEAGDVTITTDNLLGQAQAITPDADAPRAHRNATYGTIDFEVTANADSDGAGEETFGVRLCTTADCADGTVLGEWTVTVAEPAADTTLSGTGATLTVPGGAAVSVMEESRNRDGRDRRATFRIDIATAPTSDIAVVAYTETGVSTGARTAPFARINSALSPDYPPHGDDNHNDVRAEYLVGYWASGATGAQEFTVISTDNAVDTPGGTIAGNLKFKVFVDNEAFRTTLGGSSSDTDGNGNANYGNATVYNAIAIPDLPVRVTGDDEPTRIRLLPTSPADNAATEGNTDKATVLVRLDRALVAGEEVTALLTFGGATPGTHFTLAAAGGQTGVTYADSEDGTQGLVTLSGAGVQEGVIEVTALMDGDSDSQTLQIGMPPFDQPWRPNFHRSNLDGGVCAAHGCPHRPQGDPGQRFQSVTLAEAAPGLTVVEHDDPDRRQATEGGDYSYTIQLNTAPTSDVTVTATIASGGTVRSGGTLTFTNGNWNTPQTVTVRPDGNSNDEPRRTMTVTHAFGGDTAYAGLADATHEVGVLDDDPTTITMAGAGVRPGGSGSNISRIMVEGDALRVDRSLTLTLGRALEAGEYVRVPLRLEAVANGNDPSLPDDPPDQGDGDPDLPSDLDPRRTTVDSYRGPRASANVAWPPHHNDFVMTATGTGVGYGHSNRYTPNHIGFRYVEFRGEGAQTATIVLHARAGFDDGEAHDEAFAITFPNDFRVFDEDTDQPFTSAPVEGNLGGGIRAMPAGAEAWFGIEDDDSAGDVVSVTPEWALLPGGLNADDRFRLIYVTSRSTAATSGDLAAYDAFVRAEITGNHLGNGGVAALRGHAGSFRAIAEVGQPSSEGHVAARDHARFNPGNADHPDVPIYWVGGGKVADDKRDFTNENWDDEANPRTADGAAATIAAGGYWTGTSGIGYWTGGSCAYDTRNGPGTNYSFGGYPVLGHSPGLGRDGRPANVSSVGYLNDGALDRNPLGPRTGVNGATARTQFVGVCHPSEANSAMKPMYALSGVFTVVADGASVQPAASAAEGAAVTFTVTIPEAAPAGGITIPYTLSDGRGVTGDPAHIVATGADYADAASGSITIAQGAATGVITVNTTDDSTYETDHYFTVTLGTPTGTNAPSVDSRADTAIGVITDDADRPVFEFNSDGATVTEGAAARVTLAVTRTGATEVASSVYWTTADDTATHPGDYTADAGYLRFAPGDASKTIAVDLVDDAAGENAETFKVRLSQPVDAQLGGNDEATITLNDDDGGTTPPPATTATVSLSPTFVTVTEGGNAEFTLTLSAALGADVTIPMTVTGVTATAGDDYTAPDPSSATVAAGDTEATFSIATTDDKAIENTELLRVAIDTDNLPASVRAGTVVSGQVLILTNDVPVLVSMSAGGAPVREGESLEVAFTLAEALDADAQIPFVLSAVTATPGADFTDPDTTENAVDLTVTVAAGDTAGGVTVATLEDTLVEGPEAFTVDIAINGEGQALLQRQGLQAHPEDFSTTVSIFDDDSVVLTETGDSTAVGEDGTTDAYQVRMAPPRSGVFLDTTVVATAGDGLRVSPAGNTPAASRTMNFTGGSLGDQTVHVHAVDDDVDNPGGGREGRITHAASYTSGGGERGLFIEDIVVAIADDDPTTVTLSAAAGNIEEGQTKEFTVTLGRGLVDGETLTAPLTFGGTATRGTDYTMTGATATGVQYNNLDSGAASVVFTGPQTGATATTATITLSATSDSTEETTPETVDIGFGTVTETGLGNFGGVSETDSLAEFDIGDGDGTPPAAVPTVQFERAAQVIYEGLPFELPYIATAVLQSSSAVAADTVVGFTVGGTATPDGVSNPDYVILRSTSKTSETILAGETEASFGIRMLGDDFHEPDETVILTLVDGEDYDLGERTTMTVTIRDLPDVRFAEASSTGLEGETVEVVVEATHDFTEAADVRFQIAGSATVQDYTAPATTVPFGVGERSATISIPVTADLLEETGETIVLNLTDEDGYDLDPGGPRQHTVTLEDNEALLPLIVRFAASGSSVVEGGTATVTVEASRPVSEDTDVAFTVGAPPTRMFGRAPKAATAATDYTAPTSPVTIASGETTATISIPITDDGEDDDLEKILLTLADSEDYDLAGANSEHTVTIFENEPATIKLTKPRLHLAEGGPSVNYGVSLTHNPRANVDVYVTSPDIDLFTVAGADGVRYQQIKLRFTRRNWETPQVVAVQAVEDDDSDSEQGLFIDHAIRGSQPNSKNFISGSPYFSHNNVDGPDVGVALPDLPVHIADDDAGPNDGGLTLEYLDADEARPIVIEEGRAATLRLRWSRGLTAGETAAARLTITGGEHGKDYEVTTDTPHVSVEALPVGVTKTEFVVTWAKAATRAAAAVRIKTRNNGRRATGERNLSVELLDVFSADGSAGQDDTPSGVRLKNGPQEDRIHVLSRDRLVVQQTTPDGLVFSGLEATGDEAELTTDNAWTEIDEDGTAKHKVKLSLSRAPTIPADVVVTISTSDSDKLSVAGSDDGDGVADTVTWPSSNKTTDYEESSFIVEFTAEEDDDSDNEVVFVYFTMTSGYGNAHPDGTLVRAFRVDINDDEAGVSVTPTSLRITEGASRGARLPDSARPRRFDNQIAVCLNTDPEGTVALTPMATDTGTGLAATGITFSAGRLTFTSDNWGRCQRIGFTADDDDDGDNEEISVGWNITGYGGVSAADVPTVNITVLDDDPAVRISESRLDLVEGAAAGSGGSRAYEVVLNAPPAAGEVVIVTPASSDPDAVSFDADSAVGTRRAIYFGTSNWDTPRRVIVYALSDGDEDDETATITHDVSGGDRGLALYGGVTAPSIAVNVLDKDGPEGIVLSTDSVRVEEGGASALFTVRLAGRPSGPVSLDITGAGGVVTADADPGADGAQTTLEFTQQGWHRPKTVWLSAEDESDASDTDDESVTLMVGGAGAAYAALPVAVTVLDDEFTGPTFTVTGSGTLTEGAAAAIFTVSADIAPTGALPVTLNVAETGDFVATADEGDRTLSFSATRALIRHSVPIVDDSVMENDGSITATLKPGGGYRVGEPSSATIDVEDDPNDTVAAAVTVDIPGGPFEAWEGESVSVPVELSSARAVATVVEIEQHGLSTATAGSDFAAGPWSVTVPAGDTTASASIALTDDTALEMDEAFGVRIRESSLPAGVTAGMGATGSVRIRDNEYTLCFDRNSFAVNEHAGEVDLALVLSRAVRDDVTVYFDYADQTAVAGVDYDTAHASSSDAVTIAAGDRNLTLTLPIHPDLASAGNKVFAVTARPSEVPDGQSPCGIQVFITSSGLVITESGGGTTVSEDGATVTDSYTIALEDAPDSDVTVTVTAGAGARVNTVGGTAGSTQTLTFGPSGANIWSTAQTITVTGVDDSIVNTGGGRAVTIAHAAASGDADYAIADAGGVSVTVTDDEVGVVLDLSGLTDNNDGTGKTIAEGASGTFTVALAADPVADATLTFKAVAGGAVGDTRALVAAAASALVEFDGDPGTAGNQNALTFTGGGSGNWRTPQTVTLHALRDGDADDNDYRFGALNSAASGPYASQVNTGVPAPLTVTDAVGVEIAPAEVGVAVGATVDYNVSLSSDPGGTVTVTPTSGDDTKATVTGGAVTFDSTNFGTARQITVTGLVAGATTISHAVTTGTAAYPTSMAGLPGVDVTVTPSAGVDVTLTASDGDANGNAVENASDSTGHRTLTLTLGRTLTGAETATVPLTVHGATVATDYTFGLQPATQNGVTLLTSNPHSAQNPAVRFAAGAGAATLRLTPVDNNERSQPYVVIAYGTDGRAPSGSGVTLGDVTGGPVGVVLVDDETGDIVVPVDWDLAPESGVDPGDEFRLVFYTSETTTAEATDIGHYDALVRGVIARKGHAAVQRHAGFFKVFGSSGAISARNHNGLDPTDNGVVNTWADGSTSASDAGVPVYWLNGARVANNYFDFCDRTWTNHAPQKVESGADQDGSLVGPWTGTSHTCGRFNSNPLGNANPNVARAGTSANNVMYAAFTDKTTQRPLYGMSPVFKREEAPVLSFSQTTNSFGENHGTAAITVNAEPAPDSALTVTYTVVDVTATAGEDYTAPTGSFTFPADAASATIPVELLDDDIFEASESFRIELRAGDGYGLGTLQTTILIIADNDGATVTLERSAYTALENAGNVAVTARLGAEAGTGVELALSLSDGTATGASGGTGADYDSDALMATIAAGDTTATFSVPITNDNAAETDETFDVALTSGTHDVTVETSRATVTIADDDHAKGLLISPAGGLTVDEGASRTYTVRPTEAPTGTVTVTITGMVNSVAVDTDPSMTGDQDTLAFTTTDWYVPRTVTVRAPQDTDSISQTATLTHTPSGGGYSDSHAATLTVTANDTVTVAVPALSFASAAYSVTENELQPAAVTLTVNADMAPSADLPVEVSLSGPNVGDTINNWHEDASIPSGQTSGSFQLDIRADRIYEGDETITVTIEAPDDGSYTVGSQASTTVTITDLNTVEARLASAAYLVLEDGREGRGAATVDGALSVVVELDVPALDETFKTDDPRTEKAVTVTLTPSDGTATGASGGTGGDFDTDAVTLTIPAGSVRGTAMIPVTDDGSVESDETFTVALAVAAGQPRATTAAPASATVTLVDNDTARGLLFDRAEVALDEGASGTYTVRLAAAPTGNVTVAITAGQGVTVDTDPSTANDQNTLTFTATNWFVPQAVTVSSTADANSIDETVTIQHAPAGGGYGSAQNAGLDATVDDGDAGVVIVEMDGGTTVSEDGATLTDTYTVALATEPTHDVTVTVTAGAGARVNKAGGTANSTQTLTFSASGANLWSTARTVTVTGVDDGADNPGGGRDAAIGHAASSTDADYTIASAGGVTARVTDDDPTTVTLSGAAGDIEEGRTKEFTVTLGRGLVDGETLTAPLTFGGTATRGTDYTMTGATAAGVSYNNLDSGAASVVFTGPQSGATATVATITLSATSDSTAEATPETVDIGFGTITETGLGNFGGVSETDSLATFSLSDPPPGDGVTVSTASLALTELGAASAVEKSYTLVLDTDPPADVTVTVANGDNTAAEVDTDAVMSGNQDTLTFTAGGDGTGTGAGNGNWAVAQTVTVRALNDGDGANESFSVTHTASAASGPYDGISIGSVAVTTTDAGHGVAVSESSVSVAENDGTATYTVVLKSAPSGNVAVTATSGATANAEVDTDAGTGGNQNTLTFTNTDWNMPQTVTVTGKGAGSTSIAHAVSTTADTTNYPTSTTIPGVSVTVTADARPEVTITPNPATVSEGEDDPTTVGTQQRPVRFTVRGPGSLSSAVTVDFTLSQTGSFVASPPATGNANLSAPPLNNVSSDSYAVTDDAVDEPNGTLTAVLSAGTGYRVGSPGTATVALIDDDPTTVTLAGGGTVMEDGGDSADVTVTLGRNLVAGETVTVPLAISGTGVAAGDYTIAPAPGSNLNAGVALDTDSPHSAAQPAVVFTGHGTDTVRVATLRVTAVQDGDDEGASEALTVGFGGGNRAVASNLDRADPSTTGADGTTTAGAATVTITDDDTAATPEVSLELQTGETSNRNGDNQLELAESGGVDGAVFNLSADSVLSATLTVCLRVTETGGDLVAAGAEGIRTATLTSSGNANGAGIYTLNWTGDGDDERNSVVTATLLAPETANCPAANGSYTVASAMASDAVLIEDDDATAVELTGADTQMAEGDATDTATLTVALGRRLYAGETIVVPFTLATSTGARLPGQATPDFAVSASGTGAAIARDNTATPSLTFTGHDTDTVRTATVTLTPVAGRDDGDTEHEAVTATLASDSALSGSGIGTTVGGGAARGTSFSASLRLTDDEAPAAGAIFSVEGLRLLENGSAQYTVRLNQEPTAAVTMLFSRTGTHAGAATVSPSSQGFYPGSGSVTSWNRPRTITVTGVDEANMRRNRALAVRHAVTTTDPAYSGYTHDLPVEVGDAPEVEAWEGWERAPGDRGDSATLSRPHTVSSTPGLWPRQDMVFGSQQPQDYVIRLSNRPEPGGTVTVNVTRSNNDLQLGLTRNGPWSNSLTVTFGDGFAEGAAGPNMAACNNSHDYREGGEAHDGTAATSWECWRKVWLRRVGGNHQCTDITHTASGGGIRARTIETIRAHNPTFAIRNNTCPFLTPREEPRTSASELPPPPQAPTRAVSNVQVAAVDAASAKVSWDAVEHATGYEVEYETTSALVDADNHVQGVAAGLTDTSFTFRHDAAEAMTLTVTVTPAHEDENGDTQVLTGLSATATIAVGPSGTGVGDGDATKDGDGGDTDNVDSQIPNPPPASCVSDEQWSTVSGYYDSNANRSPNYGANWYRVLIAYRLARPEKALPGWEGATAKPTKPYTADEAEDGEKLWSGWTPVREVLQCLEKTDGGGSTSTVTRDTPNGSQSGEVGNTHPDEAMERNRREPQTGPAGFEPEAPPDFAAGACVSPRLRSEAVARAGETWRGPAHVERWLRVGRTFSGGANDATVVTPAEASFHAAAGQPGWLPVADALQCMERQFLREAMSR